MQSGDNAQLSEEEILLRAIFGETPSDSHVPYDSAENAEEQLEEPSAPKQAGPSMLKPGRGKG